MRLALLLLLSASALPAQSKSANIPQLRQTWVNVLEAGNLEAALALYTTDAVFINPDGTHAATPAELRQLYTFVFAAFQAKVELTSRKTGQSDSLAYDSGSYTETVTEKGQPSGQGVHHISGDYLTLYRREPDGQWRIVEQIWTEAHHIAGT